MTPTINSAEAPIEAQMRTSQDRNRSMKEAMVIS
jgi:hypothetical protein